MTIYEIAEEKFNKKPNNYYFIYKLEESISKLPAECKISKVEFREKYYVEKYDKNIKNLYLKEDVKRFFRNYVPKASLKAKLKKVVSDATIHKYYKKLNPTEIILGGNLDVFVSIEIAQELTEIINTVAGKGQWGWRTHTFEKYKNQHNYLSLDEVMKKLNCSYATTQRLIKEKLLFVSDKYGDRMLFEKEHVFELFSEQARLIEKYSNNYYTAKQIQAKYSNAFAQYIKGGEDKVRIKVTKVDPPLLLISHFGVQMKLYEKNEIDNLWADYKLYLDMNSMSIEDPFEDFLFKVEQVLNIKFTKTQQNTKLLWYQYVEKYLLRTRMSDKNRITFLTNQFARCTEIIFTTFNKEIYSYSGKEINSKFLNDTPNIRRSYQGDFYYFLKQMLETFTMEGLPLPYSVDELNDPRTFKRIKEVATDIYSLEEYHELYKYTNRVGFHKEKAIQDVTELIQSMNYTKYKRYDSCWLYILVQLTNNWRHSTVLSQIPRIDLSTTSIENLEWLKRNDPSVEDANNIIYQISRYVTKINKTDVSAEGIFTIGEPLKVAFATAISICEFRRRATLDSSSTLIDLSGHLVKKYNPHKDFFSEFTNGFKFENRKMNRTLNTLIWSVLRHMGKGLKESQVSRSHLQDQTTINHYIKLSNEQVKNLVDELFERNQFGFVTQTLTNILFGTETNKSIETERMLEVNKQFGDVFKIEATAGLINRITTEREHVLKYLAEFDMEGLRALFYQSLTGSLPSKQRYHQCIYAECKYENEYGERPSCDTCAASMINVYALENIMDNYIFMMEKIAKEFDSATIGEKQKLANQFFLLHNVVDQARSRFGREVVDGFVEGNTERIKNLGLDLSTKGLKSFRTSGILGG
ncbi:helix-turn-helix domain-containing protein [Listeria monocytogenes]|uniref:Helix-turn-helix domain-containing protein n=2 Tax=Lactobacillales TaxID=186826 RepID=A0A6G7WKL8_9LACT|nr:DNA-binding protein [Enterococcus faecium]EGP7140218.1 helix-turn-helix domain-containing protein [Listeria monocytogenes]QIK52741.1 helix-turn-helix domain-containing protein [Jeotgalibaca porci]EGP5195028.1 DNA-binding protein [Enterococcus faecium]EGP7145017.1 helix-turn-helix domain-containing protein [Listeria monocytogenes]